MTNTSNSKLRRLIAFTLVMGLLFALTCSTALAEYYYVVHESGYLDPGETLSGSFTLTGGAGLGIIVGAGNSSGTGTLWFCMDNAFNRNVQCNGTAQSLATPYGVPNITWSAGSHWYVLRNDTSERCAYTLAIIEDR